MTGNDACARFFLCRARMEKDMELPSSAVITALLDDTKGKFPKQGASQTTVDAVTWLKDYRRLAEMHRPTDPAQLCKVVNELQSIGLTANDIGAALRIHPAAVCKFITTPVASAPSSLRGGCTPFKVFEC